MVEIRGFPQGFPEHRGLKVGKSDRTRQKTPWDGKARDVPCAHPCSVEVWMALVGHYLFFGPGLGDLAFIRAGDRKERRGQNAF